MTTNTAPLLTIDDLTALPDDDGNTYELLEGELIVSSAPSIRHQRVIKNLTTALDNYLAQTPIGEVLPTPGVIFDRHNSVIPDIVFVTNEQLGQIGSDPHIRLAPALAVEVVSPGSENARRDRVSKVKVYGKFGVGEYWVADPVARTVEIYRPAEGALVLAATVGGDEELTSPLLPGFACKASRVFGTG
ncbi:MAG: Uma2 family endonuclease [Acidobacteria bacterium]|nr:Uma2 family endonuclease [Acidobacteriota bacterium]